MGLTDGHLVWGDDIPAESEMIYYRQIANLEKENARLLHDCNAYKKAIKDIRAEIEQVVEEENKFDEKWARGLKYALKIIDKYKAESEEI